ncbi:hypothetical protein E0H88_00465 [Acinetobacter sp. ANC 4216]|uniref:hypothetical protein n=1 Tax=Acinetobacter sp. ANC 4216 TaxID=2529840 RepID=UPI00103CC644|nr:hypothetical protein [Acinetobacter sp. ANC 4216]TCB72723.1 hypothetical protein E0H88_00465 [Acinetobacter sp. ANC 4216]
MHFKLLGLSLVTGMISATAFAEPAIQPGDTLESLSKVKVNTTVNGQAGSIENLVASGQIRIVEAGQVADQEIAAAPVSQSTADTPVNAANMPQADTTPESATIAPANIAGVAAPQEAFAATPEAAPQPDDAVQAAPATEVTDTPVNASPEMPVADATEN